jgi:hypothetical protein
MVALKRLAGYSRRGHLSDRRFIPKVFSLLAEQGLEKLRILLTVPGFFAGIAKDGECSTEGKEYAEQYAESVAVLRMLETNLQGAQKRKPEVGFHPGASSLSTIVTDMDSAKRAKMFFTPKWATDHASRNRVFCEVTMRRHKALFQKMTEHIEVMWRRKSSLARVETDVWEWCEKAGVERAEVEKMARARFER